MNVLAPIIATTSPLPDFVFLTDDNDDTLLLFPTPDTTEDIARKPTDSKILTVNEDDIETNELGSFPADLDFVSVEDPDYYDELEKQFDDEYDYNDDTDELPSNQRRILNSERRAALQRNRKRPTRRRKMRRKKRPVKRKKQRENNRDKITRQLRQKVKSSTFKRLMNSKSRRRKSKIKFPSVHTEWKRKNSQQSNSPVRSRQNRKPNRSFTNNDYYDSIEEYYEDYDDYNSVEYAEFNRDRFTELDFDDNSDEKEVAQWYFDYYDYDLENNKNAEQNNKSGSEPVQRETPVFVTETSPTVTTPMTEVFAEVFDTDELLAAFNVSDMTNIAALMTFFNNQDLFRMLKDGRTHRQTFNRLVTELGLADAIDVDEPEGTSLKTDSLSNIIDDNSSFTTAANESPKSGVVDQQLATTKRPKPNNRVNNQNRRNRKNQNTNNRNNQNRNNQNRSHQNRHNQNRNNQIQNNRNRNKQNRNIQNRNKNNGNRQGNTPRVLAPNRPNTQTIGQLQPFQIVQPFQLLQNSGLSKPTTTENFPASLSATPTTTSPINDQLSGLKQGQILPKDENVQNFLMKFGKSSQVNLSYCSN